MRVGFDREIFLLQNYGGVSKYFTSIVKVFQSNPNLQVEPSFTFHRSDNLYLQDIHKFKPARWQIRAKSGLSTALSIGPIRFLTQTWSGGIPTTTPIDLLHATYYRPTLIERFNAKKIAVTVHDFIPEKLGWNGFRNPHIGKKALVDKADVIICVSQNTANELEDFYGISKDRVSVIHHGIDDAISLAELKKIKKFSRPTILYVGHRAGYKDFQVLPKAIRELKNEISDAQLVLIGPLLTKDEIHELNIILGDDGWQHHSFMPEYKLNEFYKKSHVHCVTSKMEGFGMTTLESLAMGTPVVATDIPVFREVLGEFSTYFDVSSVGSLAYALKQVLDPANNKYLSEQALVLSKSFSWQKSAELHAQAYERAIFK